MTPYYQKGDVTLFHGDCREVQPECDLIVTDPPYGQEFVSGRERQWQAHMEDKAFRAWVENQNPINCPSACVDGSTRGVIARARAALKQSEAVP